MTTIKGPHDLMEIERERITYFRHEDLGGQVETVWVIGGGEASEGSEACLDELAGDGKVDDVFTAEFRAMCALVRSDEGERCSRGLIVCGLSENANWLSFGVYTELLGENGACAAPAIGNVVLWRGTVNGVGLN
jgi:hypothetical protein